jgi:DNA-binding SARP family transcriptional activator
MGTCRLLLLGPPLFARDDGAAPIKLRKALALAAYLAVEQRGFLREHLAALLWPDLGQHGALANLRRMLLHLRENLGNRCITTDGDLVRLDPAVVDSDFAEFCSLLRASRPDHDLEHLEAAAALYRGGFLEGFTLGDCLEFNEWQDGIRRRIEGRYDEVLENLSRGHLLAGRAKSALPHAERWLELDLVNESAHRMLMEIHASMGRADLARRQFDLCSRTLVREGLEPEEETRKLYETIRARRKNGSSVLPAGPARDAVPAASGTLRPPAHRRTRLSPLPDGTARRRRPRRIAGLVAGTLVIATIGTLHLFRNRIVRFDLSVAAVETVLRGNELERVRIVFRIDGIWLTKVRYTVAFSSDQAVVAPRTYVVYEDTLRMHPNADTTVEVDLSRDIREYVDAHAVRIPPGIYTIAVTIDPEDWLWVEAPDVNNRMSGSTKFSSPGTAPEAAVAVNISYAGPGTLDRANPLKLFLGAGSTGLQREGRWARFMVTGQGTYYLPVDDIPERDDDSSGYVLVVIHDARNNLERPDFPGPGDLSAIYKGGAGDLSYGVFNVAAGTALFPGPTYDIRFAPPPPPAEDAYEVDDQKELGTIIDDSDLPVRQRHTFHDEGTGDTDEDWFRITLGAGDTLTVETYSAGGAWECDTAISIADAEHYIRTANDKSEFDLYSRLTYRNETSAERSYYFQVKPYPKYLAGINRFADYIVEFRR